MDSNNKNLLSLDNGSANSDIILYQEQKADSRNRLSKKATDITPIRAKKNYYDDADIKYFTRQEIKSLINGTAEPFNKMLFLLLYETAGRVNEVRNVRFGDIDQSALRIKLLTLKQRSKSQIYRFLKISDKLMSLILMNKIAYKLSDEDYVLSKKPNGKAMTQQNIDYIIKKNVKALLGSFHKDKAHPHTFRHTRAIHLLDSGMNIMLLKNFLGHSNISNTLIYLKYSNADMAEAIDKANLIG